MATFTPVTDIWTQGYDQFGRPCWLNKKTREIYYEPSGQVPTQPHKAGGKKKVDEEGQWYLQRNEKGEEYYLNTTTLQWQYETPNCLKKSTRGK